MHIQTHAMSGWLVGNLFPLDARERFFCMLAASVADLDGLGWVISQDAYWDWHHVVGHNLVVAVATAGVFAFFSKRRLFSFFLYFALFHLHLLMDLVGSGEGWGVCWFWPFSDKAYEFDWVRWELYSWQNLTAGAVLLAACVGVIYVKRRTPLEYLMPGLDRKLVGLFERWRDQALRRFQTR